MKNLKTILIAVFLLQNMVSFGQTKEETVNWLNENGSDLSSVKIKDSQTPSCCTSLFKIDKVDNDSIYYTGAGGQNDINFKTAYKYSVSLKDIRYEDISTLEKDDRNFYIKINKNTEKVFDPKTNENTLSEGGYIYFLYKDEKKAERVIKAIMHLAKLSGAKENKQTF